MTLSGPYAVNGVTLLSKAVMNSALQKNVYVIYTSSFRRNLPQDPFCRVIFKCVIARGMHAAKTLSVCLKSNTTVPKDVYVSHNTIVKRTGFRGPELLRGTADACLNSPARAATRVYISFPKNHPKDLEVFLLIQIRLTESGHFSRRMATITRRS